jgi:hypothetical protein
MSKVTNEELVQKAVVTTDAIASQGRLNAKQSDQFIDYVVDMSGLKNNARIVRVATDWEVDKIGIGTRVAVPKAEASAPSVRRGVSTTKILLTPKVIMVPFEISDEFREENLEGASIEDHIIRMMAAQLSNDLEELYLNGDTLGIATLEGNIVDGGSTTQYVKDTYLAMFNGWLKQCRTASVGESKMANALDAAGASVGPTLWSNMIKAMPKKFKRNMSDLRIVTSMDLIQNYREKMATRQTQTGESALNSMGDLSPFGVPLVSFPLFPFNPTVVKNVTFPAGTTPQALDFAPIVSGSVVVTPTTLGSVPTTKYIETTEYVVDYTAGTIYATGSGTNLQSQTVKVTYQCAPQAIMGNFRNFVVAIGRDITIEKDRDIFKGVNQYAITCKVACTFEEPTALVWAKNIGESV